MKTTTHTPPAPVAALRHTITKLSAKEKTVIHIRLDDECRNGHEDFSVTADIYEKRGANWYDVGGGCCHEHILDLCPELKQFTDLHLCDSHGAPMHAAANAFYWFAGWLGGLRQEYHGGSGSIGKPAEDCRRILQGHIRATDAEMETLRTCGANNEKEIQAVIEDLKLPERWQAEANAAIARLERLTGQEFQSQATRRQFDPLTPEERAMIAERRASGYYEPAAVAARAEAKAKAQKEKARAEALKDANQARDKIARKLQVKLWEIENSGPRGLNVIYYDHTNTITANWSNLERLIPRDEWEKLVAAADLSKLPEGVKFAWQPRPVL